MADDDKNRKGSKKGFQERILLEEYYKKQHKKMKKQKPTKHNEKPTVNHKTKTPTDTLTFFKVNH